jgi:hypothetical protein
MNSSNNNPTNKIFDDLEKYLEFCKEFGYRYDESTLYNMRSYPYQQFTKFLAKKPAKNMWVEDAKKFEASLND